MSTQSNLLINDHIGDTAIFSAPLGLVKKGHLEITRDISNFDLAGDPETQDLFQGQFSGLIPAVRSRKELVRLHYRRSMIQWFKHRYLVNRQAAKVILNASIPWQIDIHGGAAQFDADLRALQLSSLVITRGVAETNIMLPLPSGTVPIYIAGGTSKLTIFHPEGASARLQVGSGASQLTFDDRFYEGIGGKIRLETPDYKEETNRFDIRVSGGVSNLIIQREA